MTQNIDQNEVNKFAAIAESWWDPTGDFKPLHVINPLRANYINQKSFLKDLKVLDVGCGGGLLAEALNAKGAEVTAIDVTEANIGVAELHAKKMDVNIDYRLITAEELVETERGSFDVVAWMDLNAPFLTDVCLQKAINQLMLSPVDAVFSTQEVLQSGWQYTSTYQLIG